MAYWLFCQACKQWSKSTTPLSDDKCCSFCNSLLVKTKQPTRLQSKSVPLEMPKDTESESSIPPATNIPFNLESSGNSDEVQIVKQDKAVVTTSVLESDAMDEPENVNVDEIPEEPQLAPGEVSPVTAAAPSPSEKQVALESDETLEKSELSASSESLNAAGDANSDELLKRPQELTTEGLIEKSDPELAPESLEVSEEAVNLETSKELEKNGVYGTLEEFEQPVSHGLSGVISAPISAAKTDPSQESAPEETIEELESDVAPDSQEAVTEEEICEGSEEFLADESSENTEESAVDEMEEPSDAAYTPGHRMFMEDRRRKRKR